MFSIHPAALLLYTVVLIERNRIKNANYDMIGTFLDLDLTSTKRESLISHLQHMLRVGYFYCP
jgi:hypothetical protein